MLVKRLSRKMTANTITCQRKSGGYRQIPWPPVATEQHAKKKPFARPAQGSNLRSSLDNVVECHAARPAGLHTSITSRAKMSAITIRANSERRLVLVVSYFVNPLSCHRIPVLSRSALRAASCPR